MAALPTLALALCTWGSAVVMAFLLFLFLGTGWLIAMPTVTGGAVSFAFSGVEWHLSFSLSRLNFPLFSGVDQSFKFYHPQLAKKTSGESGLLYYQCLLI